MQFQNPPVIICGAHGGGTSYLTKMLRYTGFFSGRDAGPIHARKFHESASFKAINYAIGEFAGDRDIMSGQAIDRVETELDENLTQWIDWARGRMKQVPPEFGAPVERRPPPLIRVARCINPLYPNSRWTWPGYLRWRRGIVDAAQPWGWKDPRNSVTLPLWRALYPKARVLLIEKTPSAEGAKSSSGAWFRDPDNRPAIDRYQSPAGIDDADTFRISFEQATSQTACFNELLNWLRLPVLSQRQFAGLLRVTGFEG